MYRVELDREYKRFDPWLQLVRCALLRLLGRISERGETEGMDGGRKSNSEPSPDYGLVKGRTQVGLRTVSGKSDGGRQTESVFQKGEVPIKAERTDKDLGVVRRRED